jgi:hypothetical protein
VPSLQRLIGRRKKVGYIYINLRASAQVYGRKDWGILKKPKRIEENANHVCNGMI